MLAMTLLRKICLEKLKTIITESKKIKLGEDYIKFLAYIVNVKIVKKFASINEDKKKKIIDALKEADTTQKMKHTKKEKLSLKLMKFVADLKSENLKDTLEKVLNSYKYEKISAKNKFEVFDACYRNVKRHIESIWFWFKNWNY